MMTIKMVNAVIVLVLNFTQSGRESVTGSFRVIRFINLGISYKWVGGEGRRAKEDFGATFWSINNKADITFHSVVH